MAETLEQLEERLAELRQSIADSVARRKEAKAVRTTSEGRKALEDILLGFRKKGIKRPVAVADKEYEGWSDEQKASWDKFAAASEWDRYRAEAGAFKRSSESLDNADRERLQIVNIELNRLEQERKYAQQEEDFDATSQQNQLAAVRLGIQAHQTRKTIDAQEEQNRLLGLQVAEAQAGRTRLRMQRQTNRAQTAAAALRERRGGSLKPTTRLPGTMGDMPIAGPVGMMAALLSRRKRAGFGGGTLDG